LWGLLVAGLLCFGLYYYVPAMLGMQTGRTLYVVGTSTFGTTGGYLIPGVLMGLLQVGWVAVDAAMASPLHHARTQPDIKNSLQRHRDRVALQPGMGGHQRDPLRQPGRQVPELGSVPHDADRALGQPERHTPLPASAATIR
jgi:hypothetical protein